MAGFKDNAKQALKVAGLLAAYGSVKAIDMGVKGAAAFTDAVDAGAKYLYDRRDLAVPAFKGVIDAIETMPRDFHMWVVGEKVEKFRREMLANLILQARSRRYLADQLATLVARSRNNKAAMLDYFAIGGQTLADYLDTGDVPDHVLRAYDLAYPNEAATMSFVEKVRSLDANQLEGFSAAVKGKLFEIDYVEYLNDGHLPEGYQADLADDPTQAGWDIKVTGPDGHIADAIQLKATNSVSYVGEALKRYPEIDVVTTDEVHSHLQMLHDVEHVTNSGIANADLASTVADATEGAALHMHWAPSIVSLALVAFSAYNAEGLSAYQKAHLLGDKAFRSYVSYIAGGAAMVLSGSVIAGVTVGLTNRLILAKGRQNWDEGIGLLTMVVTNMVVLRRLIDKRNRLLRVPRTRRLPNPA